jgi:hypothetical protein
MQIKTARAALRLLIRARDIIIDAQRLIAPANGDAVMIDAVRSSRRNTEAAIHRLCDIVPNADILYAPLMTAEMINEVAAGINAECNRIMFASPRAETQGRNGASLVSWCEECQNPGDACTCAESSIEQARRRGGRNWRLR